MKIGVIGLGLIGGSVAKAAKRRGWRVVAYDENSATLRDAKQQGIVDEVAADCASCVADGRVDFLVVAVPVMASGEVFARLAPMLSAAAVVTDAGSVKQPVLDDAARHFQDKRGRFVAAHPIAGREDSGFAASGADLFDGRVVILCGEGADADAVQKAEEFWRAVGGRVVRMTAARHDELFAHISHLPHVLSYALVAAVGARPDGEELLRYAGGGFRDFVRIAASDPRMWRDICIANRAPLVAALADYRRHLSALEKHIESGDGEALFAMFDACRKLRRTPPPEAVRPPPQNINGIPDGDPSL